jgi:hypothetical protein
VESTLQASARVASTARYALYPDTIHQTLIVVLVASADSGIVPPALNGQGFYDTMWGYLMTSLHVRLRVLD